MHPKLLRGALKAAALLESAYGSDRGVVLIQGPRTPYATKDGALLIRQGQLSDPLENMGFRIVAEACLRVGETCGDGTSTTGILIAKVLEETQRELLFGVKSPDVIQMVRQEATGARQRLREARKEPTRAELHATGLRASHGDTDVADTITRAVMATGDSGNLVVLDGLGTGLDLQFQDGYSLRTPVQHFGTQPWLKLPQVAVVDRLLTSVEDVQKILESITPPHELVIVGPGLWGDARKTVQMNAAQIPVVFVEGPHPGPFARRHLEDIAALSGAKPCFTSWGMSPQDWDPSWFGLLEEAHVTTGASVLTPREDLLVSLETYCENLKGADGLEYDRDLASQRRAALLGGLAVLHVGGVSDVERVERKGRIEDTIRACQMLLQGGYVEGGLESYVVPEGVLHRALRRMPLASSQNIQPVLGLSGLLDVVEATVTTLLNTSHTIWVRPL